MNNRKVVLGVYRDTIEVRGIWPGWDTAIAIINHVHPDTSRDQAFDWVDNRYEAANMIGRRIRDMRTEGGIAAAEEYYKELDDLGYLTEDCAEAVGGFPDLIGGQELFHYLEEEALQRLAAVAVPLKVGPYWVKQAFLDATRKREIARFRAHADQEMSEVSIQ